MLLVLSNFYSTLCTIINSSPIITGGSLLSTNTIIIQVLTEKRNIKIGSSQIVLVAHTKEKRKLQQSKFSDRDKKKKIKCNCYKKDYFKSECQKLKVNYITKKNKSGEKKNFSKDLITKIVILKYKYYLLSSSSYYISFCLFYISFILIHSIYSYIYLLVYYRYKINLYYYIYT